MLDKIIITKAGNKGEASVYIEDEDGVNLCINGFVIDMSDGVNPVSVMTYKSSPIISGNVVSGIKDIILDVFNALSEVKMGIFEYKNEEVTQL